MAKWFIKDLSDGTIMECHNKRDVLATLYRPIIEKLCDPSNFEVTSRGQRFEPYLMLGLAPAEDE